MTQRIDRSLVVEDLVADERMRLMQAETILQCAAIAFDYCEDGDLRRPYFPNIASAVCEMIRTAIDNLDKAFMRTR